MKALRTAWTSVALAACSDPGIVLRLEYPNSETLVVLRRLGDGQVEGNVVGRGEDNDLAALNSALFPGAELAIARYSLAPEALELQRGLLPPASAETGARPLPAGGILDVATVRHTGDESVVVVTTPGDSVPTWAQDFRYGAPCPMAGPEAPVELDPRCPIAPRLPECWSASERIPELSTPGTRIGSVIQEGDATWLYLASQRFDPGSRFGRHGRVKLTAPGTPDMTTLEPLATLPAIEGEDPNFLVAGWASAPQLRSDAREMYFSSSYPDRRWEDEDAFRTVRGRFDQPWRLGLNVVAIGNSLNDADHASSPVLLGDWRTAVWVRSDGKLASGFREEGSGEDFIGLGAVDDPALSGERAYQAALSCDRGHVFVVRHSGPPMISQIATETGGRGASRLHDTRPFTALDRTDGILSISEASDCSAIYWSNVQGEVRFARRRPCE